jgi:hypothetical protein
VPDKTQGNKIPQETWRVWISWESIQTDKEIMGICSKYTDNTMKISGFSGEK